MKKLIVMFFLLTAGLSPWAQKVDSIFFHLYTDSLKKGTHNYINVDGKLSNGHWMPLTSKDIKFTSSACEFSGNELIVPWDFKDEKIIITAQLKSDPSKKLETTIWIKKKPDPEILPGKADVMQGGNKGRRRR